MERSDYPYIFMEATYISYACYGSAYIHQQNPFEISRKINFSNIESHSKRDELNIPLRRLYWLIKETIDFINIFINPPNSIPCGNAIITFAYIKFILT